MKFDVNDVKVTLFNVIFLPKTKLINVKTIIFTVCISVYLTLILVQQGSNR